MLEGNPAEFELDRELSAQDVDKLVDLSVERLCEKDSPSLETIKMQVGFDSSYVKLEDQLQAEKEEYERKMKLIQKDVLAAQPKGSADFDALTSLYRQIFSYLLSFYEDPEITRDRVIEREIAAALESVFPRIGLKSFVHLSADEKRSQLGEMARIVLGIRLFNRELGKGGAGLRNIEEEAYGRSIELRDSIEHLAEQCQDVCLQYQVHAADLSQKDSIITFYP